MTFIYARQRIRSIPTEFVAATVQEEQFIDSYLDRMDYQHLGRPGASDQRLALGCLNTSLRGDGLAHILAQGPYDAFLVNGKAHAAYEGLQIEFVEDAYPRQQRENLVFFNRHGSAYFWAPRFILVLNLEKWQAWAFTPRLEFVPIDQVVRLCIVFYASYRKCFFAHGCALQYRDRGFLFTGKSGSGKTTLANMSDRYEVLNDEMVLVDCSNGRPKLCGTPFRGSDRRSRFQPGAVAAAGAFFLVQAPGDAVTPLSAVRSVSSLGRSVFNLHGCPDYMERTLDHITEFCRQVPAFKMEFTRSVQFLSLLDREFFHE